MTSKITMLTIANGAGKSYRPIPKFERAIVSYLHPKSYLLLSPCNSSPPGKKTDDSLSIFLDKSDPEDNRCREIFPSVFLLPGERLMHSGR